MIRGSLIGMALAAVSVVACSKAGEKADTTVAAAGTPAAAPAPNSKEFKASYVAQAKAKAQPLRVAANLHTQGFAKWYGSLDTAKANILVSTAVDPAVLSHDSVAFQRFVQPLAARSGSGNKHFIRVLAQTNCMVDGALQEEVRLEVEAMKNAGKIEFDMYELAVGTFFIAKIKNESRKCDAYKYEIPKGKTVYWIVKVAEDGTVTSDMIDSKSGKSIGVPANLSIYPCAQPKVDGAGDEATPKKYMKAQKFDVVCNHEVPTTNDPVTASLRTVSPFRLARLDSRTPQPVWSLAANRRRQGLGYDDWSMWIACGTDCCYADP